MSLEQFEKLKEQIEKAEKAANKAEGALEQTMAELKVEFNCFNLVEAQELLEKILTEEKTVTASFDKAVTEFQERWQDVL